MLDLAASKADPENTNGGPRAESVTSRPEMTLEGSKAHEETPIGSPKPPVPVASTPTRSPLSWQQRPGSVRGPRPISLVERARASPLTSSTSVAHRDDIAASQSKVAPQTVDPPKGDFSTTLASKDPSWFRQTPDRGVGSTAFRKGSETVDSTEKFPTTPQRLHGIAKSPASTYNSSSTERQASETSPQSTTASESISSHNGGRSTAATSIAASVDADKAVLDDLHRAGSTRLGHRSLPSISDENVLLSPPSMSPSQGRLSPDRLERPSSPTKGMGGFVQSAMLRRSDSLNKRWSAQGTTGLHRASSNASPRTSVYSNSDLGSTPLASANNTPRVDRSSTVASREGSPSRLLARSSMTNLRGGTRETQSGGADTLPSSNAKTEGFPRFTHSRSRSTLSMTTDAAENHDDAEPVSPTSPSKRFSPSKSSWLESALTKPETAKPLTIPTQPSWLSGLNKNKQNRESRDLSHSDVLGADIVTDTSLSQPTATSADLNRLGSLRSRRLPAPETKPKPIALVTEAQGHTVEPVAILNKSTATPTLTPTKETVRQSSPPGRERVNEPPKIDFRNTLRSRQPPTEKNDNQQLEFQNVFGKLRRTHGEPPPVLKAKPLVIPAQQPKEKPIAVMIGRPTAESASSSKPEAVKPSTQIGAEPVLTLSPHPMQLPQDSTSSAAVTHQKSEAVDSLGADSQPVKSSSTSSKLADKFNPGLVHLLSKRQTAPAVMHTDHVSGHDQKVVHGSLGGNITEQQSVGQPLQHMTKDRARGPKRRAPKSQPAADEPASRTTTSSHTLPQRNPVTRMFTPPLPTEVVKTTKSTPPPVIKRITTPVIGEEPEDRSKPPQLHISPIRQTNGNDARGAVRKPSKPASLQSVRVASAAASSVSDGDEKSLVGSSENWQAVPEDEASEVSQTSVRGLSASWARSTSAQSRALTSIKAPIRLPTQADEQAAMERAGLTNPSVGGKENVDPIDRASASQVARNSPLSKTPQPLIGRASSGNMSEKPGVRKPSSSIKNTTAPTSSGSLPRPAPPAKPSVATIRPVGQTPVAAREIFAGFFSTNPKLNSNTLDGIDIPTLFAHTPDEPPKIKTLRKTISELSTDGKLAPLPAQQDHVLYSDAMYLCTHIFGDIKGSRITEVYLWLGAAVSESHADDAATFARRHTKEKSGVLHVFRQGREPTNFLQALGGILITRQGSRDAVGRGTNYILCCRRHLGHITFDEVALSIHSLCAGFPFLIASEEKLYLWKGRGCTAEELGCARLIAMDMAPAASLTEIDDGAEPASFLALFPGAHAVPASADYWAQKPQHEAYATRLFRIDTATPLAAPRATATALWQLVRRQSQPQTPDEAAAGATPRARATELTPFIQSDLEPDGVYVLDAFFEIYV